MVKVSIEYEGDLRCAVRHEMSGAQFCTDAPVDNHGKGESFSPTDLCASALGSCMGTIVGIQMEKLDLDMTGMRIEVTKEMSNYPPRRISRLATGTGFAGYVAEAKIGNGSQELPCASQSKL